MSKTASSPRCSNVDLGVFSWAVGSAQQLRDGIDHFDAGVVREKNTVDSHSFERARGADLYDASQNTVLYRSFRMTAQMYTPTKQPARRPLLGNPCCRALFDGATTRPSTFTPRANSRPIDSI